MNLYNVKCFNINKLNLREGTVKIFKNNADFSISPHCLKLCFNFVIKFIINE